MISTGHVFVNFTKKTSYLYKIRPFDCIIVTVGGTKTFAYFWRNFRTDFLKFGKTRRLHAVAQDSFFAEMP